jgi:hypothetical protein
MDSIANYTSIYDDEAHRCIHDDRDESVVDVDICYDIPRL